MSRVTVSAIRPEVVHICVIRASDCSAWLDTVTSVDMVLLKRTA